MSRCSGPLCVALVVSTLVCFPQVAAAEERPIIEITPGRERVLRVAVQRFRDDFLPPDAERADRLLTAIEEGLDFNGVLLPLARAAFLGPADTKELAVGRRSDCIDFKQSGADALVDGVIRGKAGAVTVEYRVFDTSRCARLLHTDLVRPPSQLHRAGFAIADDL